MSDNIDYDELDKAVNEAIKSRAATKPATKPVAKKATVPKVNVVKNTTTKPVVRSHGQYMDFVAKRPLSNVAPAAQPAKPVAQQPIVKRVLQPQPARPVTATRPAVARPVTKPVITKPVARVQRPIATKAHATQPVNHSVAQQMQRKQQAVQAKATPAAPKPVAKPAPKAPAEEDKAPNANNYSLGGRSPFMINTKVDKRPLGTNIPENSARTVRSTKNTYSQKDPSSNKKHKANKHIVTESPKKHSGWIWTLIVLLIIAAGAGLGYLAYLLVFAN